MAHLVPRFFQNFLFSSNLIFDPKTHNFLSNIPNFDMGVKDAFFLRSLREFLHGSVSMHYFSHAHSRERLAQKIGKDNESFNKCFYSYFFEFLCSWVKIMSLALLSSHIPSQIQKRIHPHLPFLVNSITQKQTQH